MEKKLIRISKEDNVAVALKQLEEGECCEIDQEEVQIKEKIPFGHKVSLTSIKKEENIVKYGYPIGHATVDIEAGKHVHVHNLKTNLSGLEDYDYNPDITMVRKESRKYEGTEDFFEGYLREDGRVGIRNEIWIIPLVGCVNTTANMLAKEAAKIFTDKVDGVYAYTHNMGCSQLNEDMACTQSILKGLIQHPNAAGVLVISLGCENNNLEVFKPLLGDYNPDRVKFLVTQDVEDEYEAGISLLGELAEYANGLKREPFPISKLSIGFKCGGSDAFSGITANALCGKISEKIVENGGSTILTEVPEMFGAETLLMKRAVTEEVYEDVVDLVNNFKNYYTRYNQVIYENPSPGNKKGGISSLEEKSLGCIQKGGKAPVVGTLKYGEQVKNNGLNLLTGPGNDQISCTNLVASGVQMILFTTGRGNPFGAPVPTLKIASNSVLYNRKRQWIDYNAGKLLENVDFETAAEELYSQIIDVASGRKTTKNEDYGYREISIFRDGVIL